MKYTILLLTLILLGCNANPNDMKRLAQSEGITDFVNEGYSFIGCADEDDFSSSFHGVKNGYPVSGYICGGLVKGYTIRYK